MGTSIRQFARIARFRAAWQTVLWANQGFPALGREAADLYDKITYNEGPDCRRGFAGAGPLGRTSVSTLEDVERLALSLIPEMKQ